MHQTFYIDIDEEITTTVEKLKRTQAKEVVMVVPKRALLIQSIVNLRILKKEADEAGLQLMIVTQDKLGKILIEKAGILVQQKMENIVPEEEPDSSQPVELGYYASSAAAAGSGSAAEQLKKRLEQAGSRNYHDPGNSDQNAKKSIVRMKREINSERSGNGAENLINKELVSGVGSEIKRRVANPGLDISRKDVPDKKSPLPRTSAAMQTMPGKDFDFDPSGFDDNDESELVHKDKKIESFFYQQPRDFGGKRENIKKRKDDFIVPKRTRKAFLVFGIIAVLAIAGILGYLFVPKATVILSLNTKTKSIDSEIAADANMDKPDFEKGIIPAKKLEVVAEVSKKFTSSGSKSVSNQKARGTITIYNEYGAESQPLVATTRFVTPDGKIFRLVDSVTVPGYTKSGNGVTPGTVEAQVVADQSGSEYNIGPSDFNIPGFKSSGNDKYTKFYAKSKEAMTGGGSGTDEAKTVTQQDIDSAKLSALKDLDQAFKDKLKNETGPDEIALDDAVNKEEAVYKISNSPGEVADTFQVTVSMKAVVLALDKQTVQEAAGRALANAGGGKTDFENDSVMVDFGKPDVNFNTGMLDVKYHATGVLKPDIDLDSIKSEILGKSEDDLQSILGAYPDIKTASVEHWPTFIGGRIPFQAGRVEIAIDNN